MPVIAGYQPFVGLHCETTATGNLLRAAGLELSEPMIFGLGEGLSYGVFTFKGMDAPFIGGRSRPDELTRTLASSLGITIDARQTRSRPRAWRNVTDIIDAGRPVAVKLNMRLLDYDTSGADFAAHYVAAYGYDDEQVFVADTVGQGGPRATSRASFEEARLWTGPMASNALTWSVVDVPDRIDWSTVLRRAIAATASAYLNPPIANFGAHGIRKTAKLVVGWQSYPAAGLAQVGMLMERGGTGGGLFRPMYASFLREAAGLLGDERLADVAEQLDAAGAAWSSIAAHLEAYGSDGVRRLEAARGLLLEVADLEEGAFAELVG